MSIIGKQPAMLRILFPEDRLFYKKDDAKEGLSADCFIQRRMKVRQLLSDADSYDQR